MREITRVERLLTHMLSLREYEPSAKDATVGVVQLLTQLVGTGAVTRTDLPPASRLERNTLAVIAADWGGRQDVDLVAMFTHHRVQFDQLLKLLSDWQRTRIDNARAANEQRLDQIREGQRRLALQMRVTDEEARGHRAETSSDGSDSDEEPQAEPRPETARADPLQRLLAEFTDGPQELSDYQVVIRKIEAALLRHGPLLPRSNAFEMRRTIERLTSEMRRKYRIGI